MNLSTLGTGSAKKLTGNRTIKTCTTFFFAFVLMIAGLKSFAQTTGDYRSSATGVDLNSATNWQTWNGGSWVTATLPPNGNVVSGNTITILATHSWGNAGPSPTIPSGVTVVHQGLTGTFSTAAGNKINNNGTYVHNSAASNATVLAGMNNNTGSTVIFRASSVLSVTPSLSARTFYNLTYESTSGVWTAGATAGAGALVINGNLDIGGSGAGTVVANMSGGTMAITVAGNISVKASCTYQPPTGTFTISGNITNAGTFTLPAAAPVIFDGNTTLSGANLVSFAGGFTVNATKSFANSQNGNIVASGKTATINGTFQVNQGSWTGSTGTYSYNATTGTLVFNNTSGVYGPIDNSHLYWPSTNAPFNVTVAGAGGINLGVARTVAGTVQTASGIAGAGNLTANGTLQINAGGFLTGTPTYGGSSTLVYNTASYTTTTNEFPASGVKNVTITAPSGTNTVTLDADKTITGTFAIGTHTVNGGKSINAATITIGTGSLVAGTLTTSATFVCSGASSISMTGSWNVTGFTKSTSTVAFTGTGNLSTATNFYNLTNSGGTRSITANFDVENTLLVSGGQMGVTGGTGKSLTMSGATSTINIAGGSIFGTDAGAGNDLSLIISGAQTTLTGNATGSNDDEKKFFNVTVDAGKTLILARGILCRYGTFAVNGTLQINANGYVQTIPSSAVVPSYNVSTGSLTYNNGGAYTTAGEWPAANGPANVSITAAGTSVVLSANRTVPNTLALLAGLVTTNSFTITVGVGGTLTRSTGYVNGNLRREIAAGPSTRTFDIGDATNYTPVTLTFASGTGAGMLTASTTVPNAAPAAGNPPTGSGISQTKYINRYWTFSTSTVTTPDYSAAFTYIDPADIVGGANTNSLIVAKNSGGTWSNPGVASSVSPTVTTVTGLTSFSDFYLGEGGCIAPTGLNYTNNTIAYCINVAISTNSPTFTGSAATSYSVSPALPAGLNLNTTTGEITGTPTVATAAADYTVTVNNACGNTTKDVNITVNADATILLSSAPGTDAQAFCINTLATDITYAIGGAGTNASITSGALPSGMTGTYSSGTFTIAGAPFVSGVFNYTITATGGSCVQGTASGTITVYAAPTATFTKTMASSCGGGADGTITVTPTSGLAPFGYSWSSNPAGFSGSTAAVTGLSPRDYTVVITDAHTCSISIPNITIWQAFPAVVTNNGGGSGSCGNTGYIILYGSGGVQPYTYSIDGTNYFVSNSFTGLAAGTYTGYVKDFGGCVTTKPNITVTGAAAMVVTANTRPASSCANNGVIELYRTGGVAPYTYSLDDVTYQGSNVFNNLVGNATYTGWVKDASGCKQSLANIAVGKAPAVTVSATAANTSACSNTGRIQILAGGGVPGYTYSLDNVTYQASNTFTGLAAGSYDAYVKDSKNCMNVQFGVTVGTNAAPTINVTASTTNASSCANTGSIQLFRTGGTGPYTYSLDNVTYQASPLFTNQAAGSYTGWVKDVNGCTGSLAGITVGQAPAVTATEGHTNTSSCANDATIQLNAGGGVPGYTYSLDNITYQPGNTFSGLGSGSYTGWVKDSKGCTASVPVTIGTTAAINVTAYAAAATNCETSNGSIQLFRTGGTGPYTYSLDNVTYQASNLFSGKLPGNYTGYVKDSKGCIGSLGIVVGPSCDPPPPFAGTNSKANNLKVTGNDILAVQAYPNPSTTEFTLVITGNSNEKIAVSVMDILGRKVQQAELNGKLQYRFGNDLAPGIYMVQVVQGTQKQSIKLIKE